MKIDQDEIYDKADEVLIQFIAGEKAQDSARVLSLVVARTVFAASKIPGYTQESLLDSFVNMVKIHLESMNEPCQ